MFARPISLAIGLLLCLLVGCQGGYTPPPPSDPNAARTKLEETLNLWKDGSQIPSFDNQSGCLVRDEDWEAGRVLKSFEIQTAGEKFGSEVRFMVNLQVTNEKGTIVPKKVRFLVSLHPSCIVRRDDTTD